MEISPAELAGRPAGSYIIYDIRDESDRERGSMPGAAVISVNDLLTQPPCGREKPIVICCSQGVVSLDIARELRSRGYDAYSLEGGYPAWLADMLSRRDQDEVRERAEHSIRKKFREPLMHQFVKALKEYKLVNEGDRVAVCISGGKDSMLMAKLFQELKRYSPVNFEVKYLVMDPGYNARNRKIIEENARILGIPITIFESDIFASVFNVEKNPCYLCARMRRGHLYSFAKELGCNKIALGHHFDDVIETILMGMLHGAQIQTMMPKLHSTNFPGMELIRPLYFIREDDIKAWRDYNGLQFLQCACHFTETCTSCRVDGQSHSARLETKKLIRELKKTNPAVEKCIFRSVENVNLDTVLAYKKGGVRHSFLDEYDL